MIGRDLFLTGSDLNKYKKGAILQKRAKFHFIKTIQMSEINIVIREVTTSKELKKFVLFPHALYSKNPYWVPSLISDEILTLSKTKNPAFEYCDARYWLAYKEGKVAGRIAGIVNNAFIEKWGKRYARFGWFDFIDDKSVSRALFETVELWALEKNMAAIHGPFGFTDFDPEGLLIDGFDRPGTMTTIYNYPYYAHHLEALNYVKDVDWVEYEIDIPQTIPERVTRIVNEISRRYDLQLLKVKTSRKLLPYARGVFDLINKSYEHLYGVVTLSEKQIDAYIKQFFSFIHPDYVSIVLEKNEVVAFAISMPSLSTALQKSKGRMLPFGFLHLYKALHWNDRVDLYLIAVRPDLQNKGVTSMLIKDLNEKFIKHRIVKAIAHPILEQNGKMISFWKGFKKAIIKRRRCYIKALA
jgi:GNAT superfamily N-acetyltransferase